MTIGTKHPCGCRECQDDVQRQVKEALHEQQNITHNHLTDIAYGLKITAGLLQRLLQRVEEGGSIPKGHTLTVDEASPAQAQVYSTQQSDVNGTAQGFLVAGPGNVSVYSQATTDIGGSQLIATVPSNGSPVFIPFWHSIKVGNTFGISTDSAAGTILTLATWVEPVALTGDQYFQLGR